jgi:hypothetical protein
LIELGEIVAPQIVAPQIVAPQQAAALQIQPHLRIPANSIPAIIRGYKSAVTKLAHRQGADFRWHSRYYDRIVRDDAAYDRISRYIITNPLRQSGMYRRSRLRRYDPCHAAVYNRISRYIITNPLRQ